MNDDIDINTEVNNCINCIFTYWILPKDSFDGHPRFAFIKLVLAKQGSLVTVKSLCMYLIKFYLSTVLDCIYPINSFHEELKIKSLFLPKLLCLTIFSLCRGDLVNCTRNRLSLGSFCVLGLWDNIVCHTAHASVASVVRVWLLTGDVPTNMTSIALYVSRKKVMNYNF